VISQTTIRISDNLMEWLKGDAKKANRSLNNHMETILLRYRDRILSEADENYPKQMIRFLGKEVYDVNSLG